MAKQGSVASNAVANMLEAVASAVLVFALYRYISGALGIDQLGIWSAVLATVSAARLADLGLSAGVIRFVAREHARGEPERAGEVIDTAALTLMVTVGALLALFYPLLEELLPHLFDGVHLLRAQTILPYALMTLWVMVTASTFQGGLDGCQRMDLRAALVVLAQALLLMLAVWLVPQYGLLGLAWAQIGQGVFLLIFGRLLLHRALPSLPLLPRRWRRRVLGEMLGYGANVQAATVFMLLLDPVTKALMARFGGPSAVGYFEVANQVVLKLRSVIVTANRAVVPHVATLEEADPASLVSFYRENLRVLVFVAPPAFSLLVAWAGLVSWLVIGDYRLELVGFLWLLAAVWAINVLAVPAYFVNMGTGRVGWNTLSHLIMGLVNAGLGWVLGSYLGAQGVAYAYGAAIIAGSGVLIAVFERKNGIGRAAWLRDNVPLILVCAAAVAFSWIAPLQSSLGDVKVTLLGLIIPTVAIGLAVWFHPVRRSLAQLLVVRSVRF